MSDDVLVSVDNHIMVVTINRPAAKNAINKAVAEGIAAAMDELDSNNDIRLAILTGAEGTFCSGMDLKAFVRGESPVVEGRGFAGVCQKAPAKPLIAAVEGYALAGGCELALACDLIVSADNARFGIPEVKRGLVAGAGGLMRLPRQIPQKLAMEWALTGDFFTAQRAYEAGLVNRVVAAGTSLEEALVLAAGIAVNGPLATAASKKIIIDSQDWSSDDMFARQQGYLTPVFSSADAREGATAFAEKRPPVWKGC